MQRAIGTLRESSLHASLKSWYFKPGDMMETVVEGSIVDIVRGKLCIEVQTQQLGAIKKKVNTLLKNHPVCVVYPIPVERSIIRIDINTDQILSKRKSPKKGSYLDLFFELVHVPQLLRQENFSVDVLLVREEQIYVNDGNGSWRRKGWSISDRRLLEVVDSRLFSVPGDYLELIPRNLSIPFTVNDLAKAIGYPRSLASKMAYTLREIGVIETVGKRNRSFLYRI